MHVAIVSAAPADMLVDKPGWMADGFRQAGHDVRRCHTAREVASADAECELLVFDQHGAGCNVGSLADLAADRKAMWVQWWRDLFSFERKMPLVVLRTWFLGLRQTPKTQDQKPKTTVQRVLIFFLPVGLFSIL
jgi:hypothetical protein